MIHDLTQEQIDLLLELRNSGNKPDRFWRLAPDEDAHALLMERAGLMNTKVSDKDPVPRMGWGCLEAQLTPVGIEMADRLFMLEKLRGAIRWG